MKLNEMINVIVDFQTMINERGWCNKVGISPTAAYVIKKRFFEGTLSVKTMNKWIEKAKNFQVVSEADLTLKN
jgi:hypothetical protein